MTPVAEPLPPRAPRAEPAPARTGLGGMLPMIVIVVAGLYFAREILIPLTLAVLLSFLLAPLVGLLRRAKLGRVPAVLLAVLFALGLILGIGGVIGTQIAGLAQDVPRYATTVEHKIDQVRDFTIGRVTRFADGLGKQFGAANPPPPAQGGQSQEQRPMPVEIRQPNPSPLELANRYLSPALSPFATLGVVFLVAVFILLQQEDLRDRLIRLIGSADLHRTTVALDDGARRLSRYFLTQLAINAGFGVVIGLGLLAIGVPSPVLWGLLSALLRFVPYVGSILSAVFPALLAAAVDPGWSMVLWTLGLYLMVEPVVGQVVEPLLYGHNTGLSPVAVVVSAIFWSWLWGPIGLVLSMPMTLCLVVLGRHVTRLEFLDVMLGDTPALTPVESFYHRALSGDADEATEHAETLLREHSLTAYYDEVVMQGLQLAAADAARGVLRDEQVERIRATVAAVVDDLEAHEDRPGRHPHAAPAAPISAPTNISGAAQSRDAVPPAIESDVALPDEWRSPNAVLCIAGRGKLDEAAAAMLAQLLTKHGVGARRVPYDAVSRGQVGALETRGVAMACLCYLDLQGQPAHLRFLVQRLRRRLPATPILVGLWPREDAIMADERLRRAMGADDYVVTLREAVATVIERAQAVAAPARVAETV